MGKPKAVNFELIKDRSSEPYLLLEELVEDVHEDLAEANIAIAWRQALKSDVDGRLVLGKCIKVSDLNKELVWQDPDFTVDKKRALLDHELCHAAPALDKDTEEQKTDSRGRLAWRIRKHDIEEFRGVVERHGCYKADLFPVTEGVQ